MTGLTDAELRMVAKVVSELAKLRDASFDQAATGFIFAAALIDPAFKARLAEAHRRLKAQRLTKSPGPLALLAPLFRELEREAEAVVSRVWDLEETSL